MNEELCPIGRFTKLHGIKGELSLTTTMPDVFDGVKEPYIVCEMDSIPVPFYIESFRPKGQAALLVKLERIDDMVSAGRLLHHTVYVPLKALKSQQAKETEWQRYEGYTLEDEKSGVLGHITFVDETTINRLFHVNCHGRELLVPAAGELIRSVNRRTKKLTLSLPDGLIELS
ncbi:MAG: 16S rRNA processing protein RimM [Tannerella sp.]|jgi:16S rRNA processing protein RimM|nr:16S rRNA processing protein RimM [Tannerella sp.]